MSLLNLVNLEAFLCASSSRFWIFLFHCNGIGPRKVNVFQLFYGAGTYMFGIDDERIIDATRAGSIAHLINHSFEVCITLTIDLLFIFSFYVNVLYPHEMTH